MLFGALGQQADGSPADIVSSLVNTGYIIIAFGMSFVVVAVVLGQIARRRRRQAYEPLYSKDKTSWQEAAPHVDTPGDGQKQ